MRIRHLSIIGLVCLLPSQAPAQAPAQATVQDTRLTIPGLRAPVEVRRDRWGVPHIYAKNTHDLFFAQGFVAAQDRLFPMEMWRRTGEGRLAEVLGPSALQRDRFARLFRYRGDMAREWTAYAPDTKSIVTAFVSGVNAYIAFAGDSLPLEFGMLGIRPEPWTPEVTLTRVTALSGVSNGSSEVFRAQLIAMLGKERVDQILPAEPARASDPAPGLDLAGISSASLGDFESAFADVAYTRMEGSNNWVISGKKSATGKPILANDPHRRITNPAVRYLTHLVAPGWNVIGAGEPASPGVAIGHNDRIAFGLTVVGMDQQDLYVETLGACGGPAPAGAQLARAAGGASKAADVVGAPPKNKNTSGRATPRDQKPATGILPSRDSLGCYWHKGAWRPVESITETIRVKGEAPRVVRLQFTVHGPIVSVDTARSRAFAVRTIHSEPGTASYLASLSLDRARNWSEFQAAMTRWLMPSENMIYADVDGNIGWVAGGIMPKRSWSGMLPVPGDGRYEWSGFVNGMQLPRAYNPASGFINTSNNNILPPGYKIPLSYEWSSPYRADRVREVLRQDRKFDVEDFERLQNDDKSKVAEALMPKLLAAARRMGRADDPDVKTLAAWDLRMSRDQIAPTIFASWAPAANRRATGLALSGHDEAIALLKDNLDYPWLENFLSKPIGGSAPVGTASLDSVLVTALDDAIADLGKRFGMDRAKWRYGDVHVALFRHPLSAKYDLPPASRSGDGSTVNATAGRDFKQTSGASFREIIDMANFDRSVVTNVPGQSADPRSKHYGDLLPLWANDKYFPLVYSRASVEKETEQVLWLQPSAAPQKRR
jgi:penicillin G amidase